MSGKLHVKPFTAKLTHDTKLVGKMSPYVKVRLGSKVSKSSTRHNSGKFPSWGDELIFYRQRELIIDVECWNSDRMSRDDLIGETSIPLQATLDKGTTDDWYKLSYKGRPAGLIRMEIAWFPELSNERSLHNNAMNSKPGCIKETYAGDLPNISSGYPPLYPPEYPPECPSQYPPEYPPQYLPQYPQEYPPQYPPQYPAEYPPHYLPQHSQAPPSYTPCLETYSASMPNYPLTNSGYPPQYPPAPYPPSSYSTTNPYAQYPPPPPPSYQHSGLLEYQSSGFSGPPDPYNYSQSSGYSYSPPH